MKAKDPEIEHLRRPQNSVNQFRRNRHHWRMPDVAGVILSATERKRVQAVPGRAPVDLKPLQDCKRKKIKGDPVTFHNCNRSSKAAKYGSRRSGSTLKTEEKSKEGS